MFLLLDNETKTLIKKLIMKGSLQEIEKCKIHGIGYCVKMLEKNMKCPFTVWIKKKMKKRKYMVLRKKKTKTKLPPLIIRGLAPTEIKTLGSIYLLPYSN